MINLHSCNALPTSLYPATRELPGVSPGWAVVTPAHSRVWLSELESQHHPFLPGSVTLGKVSVCLSFPI